MTEKEKNNNLKVRKNHFLCLGGSGGMLSVFTIATSLNRNWYPWA